VPFECLSKGKGGSIDKYGDVVTKLEDGGLIEFTDVEGVDIGRHGGE